MRNTPPALLQDDFIPKYEQYVDGLIKLPVFQRNVLKHQLVGVYIACPEG
jgi:hypothetical protein